MCFMPITAVYLLFVSCELAEQIEKEVLFYWCSVTVFLFSFFFVVQASLRPI